MLPKPKMRIVPLPSRHLKSTYAGLAGILTALIFLQLSAAIFIFGAEVNAALLRQTQSVADNPSESVTVEAAAVVQP